MTTPRPDDRGTTDYPTEQAALDTVFTMRLPQWPIVGLLGRNQLLRPSHRVEAAVWALIVVVSLLAVPIAAAIGTAVYDTSRHAYAEQALTRHTVTATVTEHHGPQLSSKNTITVPARWVAAGTQHTGAVQAPPATKVGDRVQIWVDSAGLAVDAPASTGRAAIEAVTVVVTLLLGMLAVAALIFAGVRRMLSRIRDIAWQRDFDNLIGHDGGHTHNT